MVFKIISAECLFAMFLIVMYALFNDDFIEIEQTIGRVVKSILASIKQKRGAKNAA